MNKYDFQSDFTNLAKAISKCFSIVICLFLLVGCPGLQSTKMSNIRFDESKNASFYLAEMNRSTGNERTDWQLLAIRSFIMENKYANATKLIEQLPKNLNNIQLNDKLLSLGEMAVYQANAFNLSSIDLSKLSNEQKVRYYRIKIGLDGQVQDINSQIRDYITLQTYGSEKAQHQTINDTWNFLLSLGQEQLNRILVYANEVTLQGWVDLWYTYENNTNTYPKQPEDTPEILSQKEVLELATLKNAIAEWQIRYATHPAAIYLPRNIYGEKYRLPDDSNQKIVGLFLPISGSSRLFGDIIHQGYTDAAKFYPQIDPQSIYIYDTNSQSLSELVKKAEQQGVELIVGPLLKDKVQEIQKLAPNIPVLALNKIENEINEVVLSAIKNDHNQICFFALSPEDEAQDAAQHIYYQKKQTPLLILPDNNLGHRVAESFAQQWSLSLDTPVYVQYFQSAKSLSEKINNGIGIELEGEKILLSPKRPNDSVNDLLDRISAQHVVNDEVKTEPVIFDAIYVYTSHDELMLIKSMLDMKSNKTELDESGEEVEVKKIIPNIYTSSRSNIANTTQDFRYDMESVQFSDIPLLVNKKSMIEEIPEYIKNDYSLVRLYAMGIDARRLVANFDKLSSNQIKMIDGLTGELSVNNSCEIQRVLSWQKYRRGNEVIVH